MAGTKKTTSAKAADVQHAGPRKSRRENNGFEVESSEGAAGSSAASDAIAVRSGASAADAVDEQLAKYRSMRDFHITAEPAGAAKDETRAALPFCIQKHAASHLHYDFRLGWNGVLKSWAVAKGPSYVVADKRLAVQVEDHPIEYGGFEGIIPADQYGGGTVMLWDQGTWEPQAGHTDVDAGLRDGSLKIVMHGTKMKGKWALIRMGGKAATERKPNWLLIKEHDEFERPASAEAVTEAESKSVVTGRDLEQIAHNEDHVWNSKETAGTGQAWYRKVGGSSEGAVAAEDGKKKVPWIARKGAGRVGPPASFRAKDDSDGGAAAKRSAELGESLGRRLKDLPKEAQPEFLKPQLAAEVGTPPEGAGWVHELKLDGYRIQARKSGKTVQMLTRSGLDWAYRVAAMAEAVARLPVESVTLDGEVVVLREDGTTNFADLQASFQEGARNPLTYFCFDLLHVEGRDPRELGLNERKKLLAELLAAGDGDEIRLSEHMPGNGEQIFRRACELHAEGIVSKRADAPYEAGRGGDWVKSKCLREQEFVVGGFTFSSDGEDRVGSLLLGYYSEGKLVYAGRTGTGFTQKMRKMLRERVEPMRLAKPAFAAVPVDAKRGALWLRPELVAQVRFATWTADDLVRQAAFLGLREDKAAAEVRREGADVPPRPKGERGARQADESGDRDEVAEGSPGAEAGAGSPAKFYVRPRQAKSAAEVKVEHAAATAKAGLGGWKGEDGGAAGSGGREAGSFAALRMTKIKAGAEAGAKAGVEAGAKANGKAGTGAVAAAVEHAPVRLTHPAKVLDAVSGVTKQMLADFYWAVAEKMLPHIADRPLSLVRCPEGSEKPCFFQKHVNHMLPKGVGSVEVPDKKTGVPEGYITLPGPQAGKEALAGLAQMGVLEVHPWGSRNGDLERPDRLIFDLDPDEALGWETVTEAAAEVRKRLKAIGLESLLKTTGGKGLHVVVPMAPEMVWPEAREFAHQFVRSMERGNPARYLTKMTKSARVGKIYLDYLRNERGATAVAPYSPRARAGMGVSMPLAWSELKLAVRPVFRVAEFAEWRGRLKKDPWAGIDGMEQRVTEDAKRAVGMKA